MHGYDAKYENCLFIVNIDLPPSFLVFLDSLPSCKRIRFNLVVTRSDVIPNCSPRNRSFLEAERE